MFHSSKQEKYLFNLFCMRPYFLPGDEAWKEPSVTALLPLQSAQLPGGTSISHTHTHTHTNIKERL